jgi:ATP-dependent helicase/nuclease subunit A
VVLRTTSPLGFYLEALKRAGVPYVVEGEKYFYGTQEVADFLNLLRAVDDPEDRIALAGVLRGPLGGVDDRALYLLAEEDALDYRREPPRGMPEVSALFAALRGFHAAAGRVPLGELVAAVLRDTQLVELAAAAYHQQQTASNLLKFSRSSSTPPRARSATCARRARARWPTRTTTRSGC